MWQMYDLKEPCKILTTKYYTGLHEEFLGADFDVSLDSQEDIYKSKDRKSDNCLWLFFIVLD